MRSETTTFFDWGKPEFHSLPGNFPQTEVLWVNKFDLTRFDEERRNRLEPEVRWSFCVNGAEAKYSKKDGGKLRIALMPLHTPQLKGDQRQLEWSPFTPPELLNVLKDRIVFTPEILYPAVDFHWTKIVDPGYRSNALHDDGSKGTLVTIDFKQLPDEPLSTTLMHLFVNTLTVLGVKDWQMVKRPKVWQNTKPVTVTEGKVVSFGTLLAQRFYPKKEDEV